MGNSTHGQSNSNLNQLSPGMTNSMQDIDTTSGSLWHIANASNAPHGVTNIPSTSAWTTALGEMVLKVDGKLKVCWNTSMIRPFLKDPHLRKLPQRYSRTSIQLRATQSRKNWHHLIRCWGTSMHQMTAQRRSMKSREFKFWLLGGLCELCGAIAFYVCAQVGRAYSCLVGKHCRSLVVCDTMGFRTVSVNIGI